MKKLLVLSLAVLMAAAFCACRSTDDNNDSSMLDSTVSDMESSAIESSDGSVASDIESGVEDIVSGAEDIVSDVVSGVEDAVDTLFGLDDFRGAYEDAGFTVTDGTYGDGLEAFTVKNDQYDDDVSYQIVTYDTAEEAKKECDRINEEGEKSAYTRGNALIIGEKDYENHYEYMKPFNDLKK